MSRCSAVIKLAGSLVTACLLTTAAHAVGAPSVKLENLRRGTSNWQLQNPAMQREIEGFASLTSVSPGGTIEIFVNTSAPSYLVQVFRIGWYQGLGGRAATGRRRIRGTVQPPCTHAQSGALSCTWTTPYALRVRKNWASGIYLAKLTAGGTGPAAGKESYVIFVVRNDASVSPYLYELAITTYQAYNNWGGVSYYPSNAAVTQVVSFDRPYGNFVTTTFDTRSRHDPMNPNTGTTHIKPDRAIGAGLFFEWDVNMVRWLEREAYDVTYVTSIDLHQRGPEILSRHQVLLDVGHDEYWPPDLFVSLRQARDSGMNLAFIGSNQGFHSIFLGCADPPTCLRPDRIMRTTALDTCIVNGVCPTAYPVSMCLDRSPSTGCVPGCACVTLNGPGGTGVCAEDLSICDESSSCFCQNSIVFTSPGIRGSLIGLQANLYPVQADLVVQNTAAVPWLFAGTGLQDGQSLPGLVGYEADQLLMTSIGSLPDLGIAEYVPIARSPNPLLKGCSLANPANCENWVTRPDRGFAGAAVYTATSGAKVFSAGTLQWTWGLDSYSPNPAGLPTGVLAGLATPAWNAFDKSSRLSPVVQQMTANLLHEMAPTSP